VTIHLRKMYVDCRYGQLHVHTAFPSNGGFDEFTPLLCLSPAGSSGRAFRPLLSDLGRDRSVYAPDPVGAGESDAPEHLPTVVDQVAAILDLIDSLRLRQVDVFGVQAGAPVATELALARPTQVRRVLLLGLPALDASYPLGERLPLLKHGVTLLHPVDEPRDSTQRADALLRDAHLVELSCAAADTFSGEAAATVRIVREVLDR
jgi:pimeloyl-ACP methyl ester carboxylesterase